MRSLSGSRQRLTVASALAAAAMIVVIVAIVIKGPQGPTRGSMVLLPLGPGVAVNGNTMMQREAVYDASRIVLADGAAARLVHGTMIHITLIGKTNASLDSLLIDKSSNIKLGFSLSDGMLISAIPAGTTSVSYEYRTPDARIVPLGTEFLLQAGGGATLVLLKEGAIRVILGKTGESREVRAGRKCVISDSIEEIPASTDDLKLFDDAEGLRGGRYAHLLLPDIRGIPVDGKVRARKELGSGDVVGGNHRATGEHFRDDRTEKRNAREDLDRERMRLRMEENKIQMNEMRRNSRTNMNQQMRRGR